jgi:hypothetical protein
LRVRVAEAILNCDSVALHPLVDHLVEVAADEAGGANGDAATHDPELLNLWAATGGRPHCCSAGNRGARSLHLSLHLHGGGVVRGVLRLEGLSLQVELLPELGSQDGEQVTRRSRLPSDCDIVRNRRDDNSVRIWKRREDRVEGEA